MSEIVIKKYGDRVSLGSIRSIGAVVVAARLLNDAHNKGAGKKEMDVLFRVLSKALDRVT